ncbi:restriction endonuclease subunit S [Mycoplasmopsis felis]|uniref:restriction endonuclease subunit S n=1 Tax=Mycoplasmopsis felis TaxID=33923 RepID=UPI002AFF95FB|nr:restriction endonuclease subunit S [Mycoplasmopsis felis]WQQ03293.1 restriction endonuclease subunit S [Mycoplasmopsis felis]
MKKVLVPRVRFKGFDEEWSEERLEEMGQTYTGLSGKTKKDFGHGNSRYITYLNIFNNPIANLKGLDRIEEDCKQNSVKYGDIFVTTSSEIPEEVGMTSIWPFKDKENIYLNSFCFGIRLNNINNYYINFLAYNLRNNELRKDIVLLAQGISRFNISNKRFMKLNILLPKYSEQQKIGKLLENIDNLITLEEIKLNKLKQLKQTLLQKMFPEHNSKKPRIRFKGFEGEWKEDTIGNIAKVINGKSNTSDNNKWGQYNLYIRSEEIYKSNKYIFDVEGVITVGDGNIGKIFHYVNEKFDLHQRCYLIYEFQNIWPKYFYYYFSQNFYKRAILMSYTATVNSIRMNTITDMDIMFPKELIEQQKIGDFFSKIDNLINLYQSKLNKLQQIKEALLQKTFI